MAWAIDRPPLSKPRPLISSAASTTRSKASLGCPEPATARASALSVAQEAIAFAGQRQTGQRGLGAEHVGAARLQALLGLELLGQAIGDAHGQELARGLGDERRVNDDIARARRQMPDLHELMMVVIDDVVLRGGRIVGGDGGERDERAAARA